jgi:hypothetical protein
LADVVAAGRFLPDYFHMGKFQAPSSLESTATATGGGGIGGNLGDVGLSPFESLASDLKLLLEAAVEGTSMAGRSGEFYYQASTDILRLINARQASDTSPI